MIYLDDESKKIVRDILNKYLPNIKVLAFGSRVIGNFKPHSDLDLCILGEEPLSLEALAQLKEAFSDSDLPMRVDVVEWVSITSEFQGVIKKCSEPISS